MDHPEHTEMDRKNVHEKNLEKQQRLEKRPEKISRKEISKQRHIEQLLRENRESKRIYNLPRVEGFSRSGVVTDQEVKTYLKDNFPERHVNNVTMETVIYQDRYIGDKKGTELGYWQERQLVKGFNVSDKEIIINRQFPEGSIDKTAMKETIAHEVGHQVYFKCLDASDRKDWENISGDRPADKCVSAYSKKSPEEDFAECYRVFIQQPETLKETDSQKYDFFKNRVFP